jgi:hypothetical protein
MVLASSVAVTATPNHEKVDLCHRTASDSNPYVFIQVDPASLPAHLNNLPGHPQKHGRDDFLPSEWQIANRTCAPETPPPPPPPTPGTTDASIIICQDPRAIISLFNYDDEPRTFLVRWVRASNGEVQRRYKTLPAESDKTLSPKWVLGRTMVWVKDEDGNRLDAAFVNRRNNIGRCP